MNEWNNIVSISKTIKANIIKLYFIKSKKTNNVVYLEHKNRIKHIVIEYKHTHEVRRAFDLLFICATALRPIKLTQYIHTHNRKGHTFKCIYSAIYRFGKTLNHNRWYCVCTNKQKAPQFANFLRALKYVIRVRVYAWAQWISIWTELSTGELPFNMRSTQQF